MKDLVRLINGCDKRYYIVHRVMLLSYYQPGNSNWSALIYAYFRRCRLANFIAQYVRAYKPTTMARNIQQERRRARWRRNKRNSRARSAPPQRLPSKELVAKVLAERDRRAVVPGDAEYLWRASWFYKEGTWERATSFVADVWAATTLLEYQFGAGQATPTRVARWLVNNGRAQGYTAGSLRTKVYQARDRIEILEQDHEFWRGPIWHPFDGSEE